MINKAPATLAPFDALLLAGTALLCVRWLMCKWHDGCRALLQGTPRAGLSLLGLGLWAGMIWPRLSGQGSPDFAALASKMVPMAEYAVLGPVLLFALLNGEQARRLALRAMQVALAVAIGMGIWQYFAIASDFKVAGFLGDRNSWGGFLAMAVPFCAVLAVSARHRADSLLWGALALGGFMQIMALGGLLGCMTGCILGAVLLPKHRGVILGVTVVGALALGLVMPRRNLGSAMESARFEKSCPRTGEKLVAVRYLRAAAEMNVLRAPFRLHAPEPRLIFGFGPGGYARSKPYRPQLDNRGAGQTNREENYDILADEPGTFNLLGVAAVEMGWLGVIGFMWFFAWCVSSCLSAWRGAAPGSRNSVLALAATCAVLGGIVASPFSSIWIKGSGPLLVLLVALARSVSVTDKNCQSESAQAPHQPEPSL
jgi:hypothetical protein